jgi:hypothetical protein
MWFWIRKKGAFCAGDVSTKCVSNQLFIIPYVIYFQAVKIGVDLIGVYNLGMLSFKDGFGYLELVTVCQFVDNLFRDLGTTELGFVCEEDFEEGEEIEIDESGWFWKEKIRKKSTKTSLNVLSVHVPSPQKVTSTIIFKPGEVIKANMYDS